MRRPKIRGPRTVLVAVCTGCSFVVLPGPWFKKRTVRHLRQTEHNHDACVMIRIRREKVEVLRILLRNVADEREVQRVRALAKEILGDALR